MSEHKITMVSLDELINDKHQYRKFKSLFNFKAIESDLLNRHLSKLIFIEEVLGKMQMSTAEYLIYLKSTSKF